jgi:dTDP-4-dehydrorhamnose reductase
MKVLLLGSAGQLGQAFVYQPLWAEFTTLCYNRLQLDVTNHTLLTKLFEQFMPDVVINCAAYTAVDKAEQQSANCFAINTDAVRHLAMLCQRHNCLLVQFSTDYVFDGKSQHAYTEQDLASPLNVYGLSKLKVEQAVQAHCSKYLIFRTSWLFSEYGNNFYRTMLTLAQQGRALSVVDDQFGCPTYAGDLAAIVLQLLQRYQQQGMLAFGLYHLASQPAVSWYQFADAIFASVETSPDLTPVRSVNYPTAAQRPAYSVLDCSKFFDTFGLALPQWQVALHQLKQATI